MNPSVFSMTEEDHQQKMANIVALKQMMNMPGWRVLTETWAFCREEMIQKGMRRHKEDLAKCDFAKIAGFDAAVKLAVEIANQDVAPENEGGF